MNKVFNEIITFFRSLLAWIPGKSGLIMRSFIYQRCIQSCGQSLVIQIYCNLRGVKNMHIGKHLHLGTYCQLLAEKIQGNSTLITQVTGIVFAECKYIMQELASYNVIQS